MSKLVIVIASIGSDSKPYTVREMRRKLAHALSKLQGDQEVSFTFRATLENYEPVPEKPEIVYCLHLNGFRDGLCHTCMLRETDQYPTVNDSSSTIVMGPLARPSND